MYLHHLNAVRLESGGSQIHLLLKKHTFMKLHFFMERNLIKVARQEPSTSSFPAVVDLSSFVKPTANYLPPTPPKMLKSYDAYAISAQARSSYPDGALIPLQVTLHEGKTSRYAPAPSIAKTDEQKERIIKEDTVTTMGLLSPHLPCKRIISIPRDSTLNHNPALATKSVRKPVVTLKPREVLEQRKAITLLPHLGMASLEVKETRVTCETFVGAIHLRKARVLQSMKSNLLLCTLRKEFPLLLNNWWRLT